MTQRITPTMRRVHAEIESRGAAGAAAGNWHGSTLFALERAGLVERVPGQPGFVRAVGELPELCGWFALCANKATGTIPHPILGDVPICDRCRRVAAEHRAGAR